MSLNNNTASPLAAALAGVLTGQTGQGTAAAAKPERKQSETWANIVVIIPGGAEDGSDLPISLPVGIALDDAKPVQVSGGSAKMIELKQAKNALLEAFQKQAAALEPGQRLVLPSTVRVELYRKNDPAQTGTPENNSLIGKLFGTLRDGQ